MSQISNILRGLYQPGDLDREEKCNQDPNQLVPVSVDYNSNQMCNSWKCPSCGSDTALPGDPLYLPHCRGCTALPQDIQDIQDDFQMKLSKIDERVDAAKRYLKAEWEKSSQIVKRSIDELQIANERLNAAIHKLELEIMAKRKELHELESEVSKMRAEQKEILKEITAPKGGLEHRLKMQSDVRAEAKKQLERQYRAEIKQALRLSYKPCNLMILKHPRINTLYECSPEEIQELSGTAGGPPTTVSALIFRWLFYKGAAIGILKDRKEAQSGWNSIAFINCKAFDSAPTIGDICKCGRSSRDWSVPNGVMVTGNLVVGGENRRELEKGSVRYVKENDPRIINWFRCSACGYDEGHKVRHHAAPNVPQQTVARIKSRLKGLGFQFEEDVYHNYHSNYHGGNYYGGNYHGNYHSGNYRGGNYYGGNANDDNKGNTIFINANDDNKGNTIFINANDDNKGNAPDNDANDANDDNNPNDNNKANANNNANANANNNDSGSDW